MYTHKMLVNQNGFIINGCVQLKDDVVQDIEIQENQMLVPYLKIFYIKPKWDFEKEQWTEGTTEQEIKEWEESNKPKPKEPTETEILKVELAENTKDLAKKDLEIEQLQKDIADITKQLAVGGNI